MFSLILVVNFSYIINKLIILEFCYGVFEVPHKYLRLSLISVVDFYYVINKLIILVPGPH
jgi:hypothetical protein